MHKLQSGANLGAIIAEMEFLKGWRDSTGVKMYVFQHHGIPEAVMGCPAIMEAFAEISKRRNKSVKHMMLNVLPPGIVVPVHTDPGEHLERWHLVVSTNQDCWWWDERHETVHLEQGFWHGPMRYWEPHNIWNNGSTDRVHLVADL